MFKPLLQTCVVVTLSLAFASCSSSRGSTPAGAGTIDQSGGVIRVTSGSLAGTTLSIPPDSIAPAPGPDGTVFQIFSGTVVVTPGQLPVGPPARISADDNVTFNPPAQLVLPFRASSVPPGAIPADFTVKYRTQTNQVFDLIPDQVDMANQLLTVDIFGLGTYWVAAEDLFVARDYLPLNDGDVYRFDNGFVMTVSETAQEPNFQNIRMFKMTWVTAGITHGIYLDSDGQGAVFYLGDFWFENGPLTEQQRFDSPWLLMNRRETIDTMRDVVRSYVGFRPYGALVPNFTGIAEINTAFISRDQVMTPMGTFMDTVQVNLATDWSENPPGPNGSSGMSNFRFWVARDVGIVAYQVDARPMGLLIDATVDGERVVAQ